VDSTKVVANKGSLDIGCGSYSYEIQVPPEPTPPSPTPTIDPHVRTVECFPTHGASDADQIVFLALPDFIIDPFCKGTEPTWMRNGDAGQQPIVPASYNHYDSTFTIASNAPELCKQVYKEEGKNNVEVQNFCQAPLKAIRDQCKYNGGKVKSDCGEWTIQSCPNGGICKLGEPGKHCKTDPGNNFCL
jgi:hypothetical protein